MTPETSLKRTIKDYLNIMHIDWFYNLQGLGGYPGLTDLCFFDKRDDKLVFLEVKTPKGHLSEKQIAFKEMVEKYSVKWLMVKSLEELISYLK